MPYGENELKARLRVIRNRVEPVLDGLMDVIVHFEVAKNDFHWLMEQAEEHELLGRKFDALVKATAKVDGQYATLHREWRKEKEAREQMEVSLKELEKELEEMTNDRNIYRSNSLDWQGEGEED